jgi:Flp pilus assembly pilin Flp
MFNGLNTCVVLRRRSVNIFWRGVRSGIQVALHPEHQPLDQTADQNRPEHQGKTRPPHPDAGASAMNHLIHNFINDEAGFIVSAELVLVSTIAVLSLVVGLTEVANGVNQELEDVASAFGSINQSYAYRGLKGHKGRWTGSKFHDDWDECDDDCDINCNSGPQAECN